MRIEDIKQLVIENKDKILSLESKSDRIESIISLLNSSYPPVSISDLILGPVTKVVASHNHREAHLLIDALRFSERAQSDVFFLDNKCGSDLQDIVYYIQDFIA